MKTKDKLEVLISQEEIERQIKNVAIKIDADYHGDEIVIVIVMKGAICLVADLIRALHNPCSLEFICGSSYGLGGTERGKLTLTGIQGLQLKDKNVLVVDDIYDSGTTLTRIMEELKELQPATLKSLVLLSKNVPRKFSYKPDYVLFEIENRFVVGYGLDYKEYYRGLPGIFALPKELL